MSQNYSRLSAVIITFNEENNIADCIESLLPVADDIVVVDSNSTDRTREICMNYRVRFIEQPFLGYVEQKNFAARQAGYAYVLSLDADERLSQKLQAAILAEKQKSFPFKGYTMNRLNNYCGQWIKHGDYYPDIKLRLWHSEYGEWKGNNPHDKLELSANTSLEHLKGDLLHYSFRSYQEHIHQMNRFSTIAAQTLFKTGKKPSVFKPLLSSWWAFFGGYFFRLGFLDGANGYAIAKNNSLYAYYKYAKLNELYKKDDAGEG